MKLFPFVPIVASAAACSIFGNSPPLDVRYYDVDPRAHVTTRSADTSATPLALGDVRSREFLRNRVIYRGADEVLREYETARWTEYPEVYMRRALTNTLYDRGPFVQSNASDAPVLDVELLAFEEMRRGGATPAGRVQIAYRVLQGERVLASDTVTIERPAADATLPSVVSSLEDALDEATHRIVVAVQTALTHLP